MSTNIRRKEELDRVAEQAAEWLLALEGAGPTEHAAFADWLLESPLHLQMFLRTTAINRLVAGFDPEHSMPIEAVPSGEATNVVTLSPDERSVPSEPPRTSAGELARDGDVSLAPTPGRRKAGKWMVGWAAAAASLAAAALVWFVGGFHAGERYSTTVGEQRAVELADGSVVHLNARSRITVHFSETSRDIQLIEGEALFKVKQDATRPFRVQASGAVVQAIGTQFNVDRRSDETRVSVIEGIVQVQAARLVAGQAVSLSDHGQITRHAPVDIKQVTAWRERRLVFDRESLEDIAAEFNRYNREPQIRIEGEAIRKRQYIAVFDADDPESLLKFLAKDPALQFETSGEALIIRAR